MNPTDAELTWSCRRGMLELDIILTRFLSQGLSALNATERESFARLLLHPDPDLFSWLMGKECPTEPEIAHLVSTIRAYTNTLPLA